MYAGFWKRLCANIIDKILLAIVSYFGMLFVSHLVVRIMLDTQIITVYDLLNRTDEVARKMLSFWTLPTLVLTPLCISGFTLQSWNRHG
ncbi:hypothetical protein L3476_12380 [Paenibacillus thiaminolyticus]|uniref:RDD family protein n=1 Tax=Paenibacillus thiaminolyticus TaxID=49283 RepID=UPI002350D3EE|nr:RDD family protein [Paenibacillus thiaminolyticus]WCR29446.1 hypothetical protein L3476_12380 [Paenibacillus thiaminolyticus]